MEVDVLVQNPFSDRNTKICDETVWREEVWQTKSPGVHNGCAMPSSCD